jgi:pilus assembly protein CpaC
MKRLIAILLLVIMVLPPTARAGQVAARASNAVGETAAVEQLDLLVGRSAIVRLERPITRVSLSTPDIADALVTTPYELLVHGKVPGTISMMVWENSGRIKTFDVAVRRDLSQLDAQLQRLFPGEAISATSNGKDVVLSGVVSSKYVVDRASSLALGYVEKADNVVNLLRQQESNVTNQVLLRVRFAEVSRSAMQELGASYFTGPNGKGDWIARGTTQQYPAPVFDQDKGLVFSDFLNLFFFNTEEQLGAVIRALKGRGLFQSLAEPNLITQDGKEASFLAGGEYPYPVVQGSGVNAAVTIVFKEFGVRLKFTPVVTADGMIQLKVAPEVSSLDFGNAVVLQGFRVPALATRRTETSVELRDGQTFAIAGMIDQNLNETLRRLPALGDIPVLGYLFRSQAYQKNATELVVMITPHIVRRDSPGVTPNLPGLVQPFLPGTGRRTPPPPPAFTTPMTSNEAPMSPSAVSDRAALAAASAAASKPASAPVAVPAWLTTTTTDKPAQVASGPAEAKPVTSAAATVAAPATTARPSAPMTASPVAAPPAAAMTAKPAVAPATRTVAATPSREEREAAQRAARQVAEHAKRAAESAKKDEQKREREAAIQARKDGERARLAAKELEKTRKADEKRSIEQQAEAARIKEIADKLAREKADRDAELEKLVTQYQKLTEGQQQK